MLASRSGLFRRIPLADANTALRSNIFFYGTVNGNPHLLLPAPRITRTGRDRLKSDWGGAGLSSMRIAKGRTGHKTPTFNTHLIPMGWAK